MGLGVCSWGLARQLHGVDCNRRSTGIKSITNGGVERGAVWRRHDHVAGWDRRWPEDSLAGSVLLPSLAESTSRRRTVLVVAVKRRRWKEEPLVKGSVTRRAMHMVKTLRSLQAHDIDAALQKWVTSMQPKRKDFLCVLKEFDNNLERSLYFKISEWGLEQSWFEAGVRDYTKLVDKYGKEGHVVEAERMFRTMEERVVPDLGTYTVLIAAYGRAKMLERVHQVLEELSLSGLELDAVFYKTVIVAYGSAGLLEEAEEVLTSMESAEVPGGQAAYLALLTAYGRLGRAMDAQRTFDRMHLKGGFRGDLKAFTALMEAYSNAKDYANAELIFGSLRSAGLKPDDRALASMISVYANANMLSRAAEVVVGLEKAGMKTGPITLTSLIGWFGQAGLVEEARQCFQELKLKRLPVSGNAYANMFAAYARAGELQLADTIWAAIEEDGIPLDDRACRVIVEGLQFHEQGQKFVLPALLARGWEPPSDLKLNLASSLEVVA